MSPADREDVPGMSVTSQAPQVRNMQATISSWDSVNRDGWSIAREKMVVQVFGFVLERLPDFSEPRFAYLAKDADARISKVVQLQQQMLRQLHSMGDGWAMSLCIMKGADAADGLTLHLLFRHAGRQPMSQAEMAQAVATVSASLMNNEYSFMPDTDLSRVFERSWANEVTEVFRPEREYRGAQYPDGTPPQEFYVPFSWVPVENRMQGICDALMRHAGPAIVEVTLVPTEYLTDERDWVGVSIDLLREAMNGETIRDEKTGRVLWQAEKLPILRDAVDSMEKMGKQYETSQMFLSSVHVIAESGCSGLADALVANSVKSRAQRVVYNRSSPWFKVLSSCYGIVDVPSNLVSPYWMKNAKTGAVPFRAQRLTRLISLEEASAFFRIPIPVRPDFPGFAIDTGLGDGRPRQPASGAGVPINVGKYLDEAGTTADATFSAQQLAKHGMVVGVPGSGKTTAMLGLLSQLWDADPDERIPFMVLEPAKTEYRALRSLPMFADDMLVFTLGDEETSPFRFNPMEVPAGIRLESHISKLQACFVGAFDLFDPLPMFLEAAIRRTYEEKGWYDDSRGGDPGTEVPTLSDLCRNATYIINHSGFEQKMRDNFQASLIERLNSLRRGSKGRMLDCAKTIPPEDLMGRPVIIELDSLNASEKSLMMMFLLNYVFEYCKVERKSGSPIRHLMVVEEAHNLIPSSGGGAGESHRGDPKGHTIELFTNMLAEMRALGEGIVIVDQLPTAVAPQAVKQTNVKLLMRVTAKDDREAIGNTMDLNEEQMHQVVNFKTGHAYLYHEGEDRVRMIRLPNFKGEHGVEEPPSDAQLKEGMAWYEDEHPDLYLPYPQCQGQCHRCDRRTRSQAEAFIRNAFQDSDAYDELFPDPDASYLRDKANLCSACMLLSKREADRIRSRYGTIGEQFGACCYIHMENMVPEQMRECEARRMRGKCSCKRDRQQKLTGIVKATRGVTEDGKLR